MATSIRRSPSVSALKWFYVFLEKQSITKIHPLGDLKISSSYLRKPTPAVGKDSFLSTHSAQTHDNYRHAREMEFLQDALLKERKVNRYMRRIIEDFLEAWELSDIYHRPITVGETRKHFNLLRGAIGYRGPAYIDKPSRVSDVQALDSKERAKKGVRQLRDG